ncbi:MAG: M42 family metallopeptidase [Clostridia bacterium]|nr:M42 family metallopeptidase [Clostridia bacterium]
MKLLKILTQAAGPSGNEERIRDVIINEVKPYADEITIDPLGNLIVRKKGPGKKLMLDAHMDEIGIIVTYIEEDGLLRFSNLGGLMLNTVISQRVRFLSGVSGSVYKEMNGESELKLSEMYIDIGAESREEAEKLVSVGDVAVFEGAFDEKGNRIVSKALDNRAGCYVLIEALKKVKEPKNDLYFVFSVSEELGLRGAKTAPFNVRPDYAVAVDVTRTGDLPGKTKMAVKLGEGACIKVKDSSVLCHPYMKAKMVEAAEKRSIPYQMEVLESGGTDTGAIQHAIGGVPSGCISLPTRYIHTPSEMVDKRDLDAAVALMSAIIEDGCE